MLKKIFGQSDDNPNIDSNYVKLQKSTSDEESDSVGNIIIKDASKEKALRVNNDDMPQLIDGTNDDDDMPPLEDPMTITQINVVVTPEEHTPYYLKNDSKSVRPDLVPEKITKLTSSTNGYYEWTHSILCD